MVINKILVGINSDMLEDIFFVYGEYCLVFFVFKNYE